MKFRKSRGRSERSPTAERHADDGVDPRRAFSRRANRCGVNWKSEQVAQIACRALEAAMAEFCDDPLLGGVAVERVEVGRGGSLRAFLRCGDEVIYRQLTVLSGRLDGLRGYLRAEIARDLNRRRAAELHFVVLPPMGGEA